MVGSGRIVYTPKSTEDRHSCSPPGVFHPHGGVKVPDRYVQGVVYQCICGKHWIAGVVIWEILSNAYEFLDSVGVRISFSGDFSMNAPKTPKKIRFGDRRLFGGQKEVAMHQPPPRNVCDPPPK